MKSLIGLLLLSTVVSAKAAYYLEDEVPAQISMQLSLIENKAKAVPAYRYNVPFRQTQYLLSPSAVTSLKNVLPELKKSPYIIIEGRPDQDGLNSTDLSRRRALTIKTFLVKNGIQDQKITIDLQTEVVFDQNPEIFNSTVYTAESLSKTNVLKSAFIRPGAAKEAIPTPDVKPAEQPIKSTTTEPKKIKKVEGTFNVLRAESQEKPSPQKLPQPLMELSVSDGFTQSTKNLITQFTLSNPMVSIESDGSIAGYKLAKNIAEYIKTITGNKAEIKPKGAGKNIIILKGK